MNVGMYLLWKAWCDDGIAIKDVCCLGSDSEVTTQILHILFPKVWYHRWVCGSISYLFSTGVRCLSTQIASTLTDMLSLIWVISMMMSYLSCVASLIPTGPSLNAHWIAFWQLLYKIAFPSVIPWFHDSSDPFCLIQSWECSKHAPQFSPVGVLRS